MYAEHTFVQAGYIYMNNDIDALCREAADIWKQSSLAFALTGAGISVPSGIPDFRSPGGIWTRHDPAVVATYQALRMRPSRVWEFVLELLETLKTAAPNPAHTALAEIETAGLLNAVVTQNIDNLHQLGGSKNVIEFHGSAARYYCMGCKKQYPAEAAFALTERDIPWPCDECGKLVRPDFVFFGEHIGPGDLVASMNLAEKADLCVIVGTSGEVAPANSLPFHVKNNGGKVIEINLDDSAYYTMPDVVIRASADKVLPRICEYLLS